MASKAFAAAEAKRGVPEDTEVSQKQTGTLRVAAWQSVEVAELMVFTAAPIYTHIGHWR